MWSAIFFTDFLNGWFGALVGLRPPNLMEVAGSWHPNVGFAKGTEIAM
jgi:hypothetical protein